MSIEESNKEIAVFMGGILETKVSEYTKKPIQFIYFGEGVIRDDCFDHNDKCAIRDRVEDLLYHKYWGWLMPVVERIEAGSQRDVLIYDKVCRIEDPALGKKFMGAGETKIQAVYEAVVEYIQYFNLQNIKL